MVAVLLSLDDAPGLLGRLGKSLQSPMSQSYFHWMMRPDVDDTLCKNGYKRVAVLLSLDDAPGLLSKLADLTSALESQSYFHWMMRPDSRH